MPDIIDIMRLKLIMSPKYAWALYTDILTLLTLSFFIKSNKTHTHNSYMIFNGEKPFFLNVNNVNGVKGGFVPKLAVFSDIIKKHLLMSMVSRW